MQIVHKKDTFFQTLFPSLLSDSDEQIINSLERFYTFGPFKPKVTIKDDNIIISIDTSKIIAQEKEFKKTIDLCEKGYFSEAKKLLIPLIIANPTNSEYHRIMGQILSSEGLQDEAINSLIDALRWDPRNEWALIMMGNIFAREKDDLETAKKYYDQALVVKPKDNIAINNIGANLLQQGKIEEAKKYFWEALKINNEYANTHYALGLIAKIEKDPKSAFYSLLKALKFSSINTDLYQHAFNELFAISKELIKKDDGQVIVSEYLQELEEVGDKKINLIKDDSIQTAAKFEMAENYNRDHHIVRYKSQYPAFEHLIMHELVHLDFAYSARREGQNILFVSDQQNKSTFIKSIESSLHKMHKMGISESMITTFCDQIFEGINRQIYNTPIDLFIEDLLFQQYPEIRPFQLISLYTMIKEGIQAVTDKQVVQISPPSIVSKSKILNIVNALQFKELFGINLLSEFKASTDEMNQAKTFYKEFTEYKDDKAPGEEYELVKHWAEDLKFTDFFNLIPEKDFHRKTNTLEGIIESIESDPLGNGPDPSKGAEMDQFLKSQKEIGLNMAVVMFMVDALQYFDGMPDQKIRQIAYEIAMQGTQGYNPNEKYKLGTVPGKSFSGYHILAWYFVSWMLSEPSMVDELQLPYNEEYKTALTLFKPKK